MIDHQKVQRLRQKLERHLTGKSLDVVLPALAQMLMSAALSEMYGAQKEEASDEQVRMAAKTLAERFTGLAEDVTTPASLH
jgi:hypothetical protein